MLARCKHKGRAIADCGCTAFFFALMNAAISVAQISEVKILTKQTLVLYFAIC